MNKLSLVHTPSTLCPSCGSSSLSSSQEVEEFQYGDIAEEVMLSALITVYSCGECGLSFTAEDASEARHNAVCRHLGVLAPGEIHAIREQYELTQAEFSDLSKIGKASLSRWEGGMLIQNQANDNLLYLLTFKDNYNRLLERHNHHEVTDKATELVGSFRPKFRAIHPNEMERLNREARRFDLFPMEA